MREAVKEYSQLPVTDESWESFARGLFYVQGNFDDPETYEPSVRLEHVDQERGTNGNRLFYLATPPSFYSHIIGCLGSAGLVKRQEIYSDPAQRLERGSSSRSHSGTI